MIERARRYSLAALSMVFLLCGLGNWIKTARELRRFYTDIPIWDAWDCVSHYARYRQFDLSVFWIQHNEHRLIVTEALFAIDMLLFHGRQLLPTVGAVALYFSVLLIFAAFAFLGAADKRAVGCAALLIVALAGYKTCVISLTIPFLSQWSEWEFLSVAALAAAVLHKRTGGRWMLGLSIAFAVGSTYTLASGMFIWFLILTIGLVLRFTSKELVATAAAGAISIALYFYRYKNMNSFGLAAFLQHPWYAAKFLGSFLGMPFSIPWGLSEPLLSSVCGWLALLIALADVSWIIRRRVFREPAVLLLGGYCALTLISASLTAIGRMNPQDPSYVAARAGRYLTEPTLFWCALIMLSVWLAGRSARGYAAPAFLAAVAAFAWITLPKTGEYYQQWEAYFQRGQWAEIAAANGVLDDEVKDILFVNRDFIVQYMPVLTENHLAVFDDAEPWWIGRAAGTVFKRGADGWIHGQITTIKKRGADYEVQGWSDGSVTLVFTGEREQILGFGWRPKAGVTELYSHEAPPELAFTGFMRGQPGTRKFAVWAIDSKNKTMWRMGKLWNELPGNP